MQRRANRTNDILWALVLIMVSVLMACLLGSPELRRQCGGKWSVPLVVIAFLIVVYLQPFVQRALKRWIEYRRDEAEKRWWRERDARERAAHIRTESMRQGKIRRNH